MFIGSAEGGVEIEQVAVDNPEAIVYEHADPLLGLPDYAARELAFKIGFGPHWKAGAAIAKGLLRTMLAYDADLVEINPLAVIREHNADGTPVERLVCLDAKITLDDSALARHPQLEELRDLDAEDPADVEARRYDLTFIKLDGDIGCMVNGAGLAMTTMDLVKRAGGEPANFLDIGGGAKADRVAAAMRLILEDPNVKAILVNIFGGITRGDEVARGLIEARAQQEREVPMVVRIVGTNAAEAAELLEAASFVTAATPRRGRGQGRRGGEGSGGVSILIGRDTRLVVQGITGREGEFHSRAMLEYGTAARGRRHARQGRPDAPSTARCPCSTRSPRRSARPAPTRRASSCRPAAPRTRSSSPSPPGIGTIFCITEGIPALDMIPVVEAVAARRRPAHRAQLPRRHVARAGQGRASSRAPSTARAGSASSRARARSPTRPSRR